MPEEQINDFNRELDTLLEKYKLKMSAEYRSWVEDDGDRETDIVIQLKAKDGYTFTYEQW